MLEILRALKRVIAHKTHGLLLSVNANKTAVASPDRRSYDRHDNPCYLFFRPHFVSPKWRIQLRSVWICLLMHCLFMPSTVDTAVIDSTACVFVQFQFLSITFVTFHHHSTAVYSIRQHKNQAEILDCYIFVALCHSLCKLINEMGKFKNLQLHRECHQRIQNILYFAWSALCFHTHARERARVCVCVLIWNAHCWDC